jgi:hypothetical protein
MSNWVTHTTNYPAETSRKRIANCDETCWLVLPDNFLTWAYKGAESVRIVPEGRGKQEEGVIVHASIKADGKKAALMFIAEGKTQVVEDTQIGDVGEHWRVHVENGWQTQESFLIYLELLHVSIGGESSDVDRIYLITDLCKAHMTETVREKAKSPLRQSGPSTNAKPDIRELVDNIFASFTRHDDDHIGRPSPGAPSCSTSILSLTMKSSATCRPPERWVDREAHRIIADGEESTLPGYVQSGIIDTGYLFIDFDFRILPLNAFLRKHQQRDECALIPDFQASNGCVEEFNARHNFFSRRRRFKRLPKWKNAGIFPSTSLECILNRHETS